MDDLGHGDSVNTENERALYRRMPVTGEWGLRGDGARVQIIEQWRVARWVGHLAVDSVAARFRLRA
ncbi:hypothetical protein [Xanthomonas vesicatoria]|uniref:Uncharacterized protein n=1 Tax=Xanthomonas vesicatoria TaxID=56460 RepID=A0ABS8L8U7_9XANT|nr:hypothetical protein [Xanthomonas vesicatoria]MCC8619207.1 hypothetical protein [Xanthomonas vesicatoria]MCC8621620.1 hypothetical protein [Xanthomonas vesicatoria]MCC8629801.1 hypothetical protein [Xanthomonas vesicatoria]MCC8693576.1 hypothetical protein [Xanthomonas vesicatoria]MCC8702890.1 hypothetical protein [Xanthomonas vesicatoria]